MNEQHEEGYVQALRIARPPSKGRSLVGIGCTVGHGINLTVVACGVVPLDVQPFLEAAATDGWLP